MCVCVCVCVCACVRVCVSVCVSVCVYVSQRNDSEDYNKSGDFIPDAMDDDIPPDTEPGLHTPTNTNTASVHDDDDHWSTDDTPHNDSDSEILANCSYSDVDNIDIDNDKCIDQFLRRKRLHKGNVNEEKHANTTTIKRQNSAKSLQLT